ncbi:LysR family transcriptional regulator [Oceaniglobus indicus]|uniref:LysR family transcriptional regulator n=1 Tax=Oceaniglobus indicus TaxID=2047749 RepID=UPI0013047C0A|nr:LysR family transcriptional regulator [Oceaniglobus indicus]
MNWLQDFICLEATRSFTQAAQQRHITQSALSRRIKALEVWLDTPLIDRTRYPVQLTDAGETFLPVARQMITGLQQARDAIRDSASPSGRVLRIAAPHSIASNHLAHRLAPLYRRDPTLQARVFSDNVALCFDLLSQGVCDLLVCYRYEPVPLGLDPDLFRSVDIGTERMVPVAARTAMRQNGWRFPGTPHDPLPLLAYDPTSFLGSVVAHIAASGPGRLWLRPRHTDAFAEAVKGMCLAGAGIAWLPERMVIDDLNRGRLARLDDGDWSREMRIALFAPTKAADDAAETLWNALQRPVTQVAAPGTGASVVGD